jgi:hypothetical protein
MSVRQAMRSANVAMSVPVFTVLLCAALVSAVPVIGVLANAQDSKPAPNFAPPADSSSAKEDLQEWSGMYTFLKEGEFVQLTLEDQGQVTGFVSRYGDGASDKGAFLDQFFKSGKLDGNKLAFTTETVHGVWFDFKGMVERGAGKNPGEEAYYVLKGVLTESSTDADKKISSHPRDVILKMFPQEAVAGPAQGNPSRKN